MFKGRISKLPLALFGAVFLVLALLSAFTSSKPSTFSHEIKGAHSAYYTRDPKTGTVIHEEWWKGNKLDRAEGPAVIDRDAETGVLTCDGWYKDGDKFEVSPAIRAAWLSQSGEQTEAQTEAAKRAIWKCNHP